jgi:hypothetical protein
LRAKSVAARARVHDYFSWEVKARQVLEIYDWVRGRRPEKPDFFPEFRMVQSAGDEG